MALIDGVTAEDVATIASAGVMGLAAVVIIVALLRPRPPSPRVLKTCLVVVTLGAITQLATKYMDQSVHAQSRVSVSLTPAAKAWGAFVLTGQTDPLQARPRLWLDGGVQHCNPNASTYQPAATDCLNFSEQFDLATVDGRINVSVEDLMTELHERLSKADAIAKSSLRRQADAAMKHAPGVDSPIGEDSN